mgnify:CR=1 FL=1
MLEAVERAMPLINAPAAASAGRRQHPVLLELLRQDARAHLQQVRRLLTVRAALVERQLDLASLRLRRHTAQDLAERVRHADGTPMAFDTAFLTPDCAPVLARDLEGGSLHQALREMGREPTTAQSWISARIATAEEARLLDIAAKAPVLVERRLITDQAGRPMEFTTSIFNAARYVIDATFTLAAPPAA